MKRLILLCLLVFPLAGCMSAYVDNKAGVAGYEDIRPLKQPQEVVLETEFFRNDDKVPEADEKMRPIAANILNRTGAFAVVDGAEKDKPVIHLKLRQIVDLRKSIGKGFVTGLTLGIVGTNEYENYILEANYKPNSGKPFSRRYSHTVYITAGMLASTPKNATKIALTETTQRLLEDLVLGFVHDLQKQGAV